MKSKNKWGFFRREFVYEDGDLYLERLRIIDTPWFGVFLHKFHRPDKDRELHDHPWNFTTVVLYNGYKEKVIHPNGYQIHDCVDLRGNHDIKLYIPTMVLDRKPITVIRHKANDFHSVTEFIDPDKPCWTLFFRGRKTRQWGFLTEDGWTDAKTYIAERENK